MRNGNLFLVPVTAVMPSLVQQLTDVGPKKPEPRLTDSQKFMRDEEAKLLDAVREQKEQKQKAEEKAKQDKLPAFELAGPAVRARSDALARRGARFRCSLRNVRPARGTWSSRTT